MKNKKDGIGVEELSKIKKIDRENWKKVIEGYIGWQKEVLSIPIIVLYFILIVGIIGAIFLAGWVQWIILFIVLRAWCEISRREGHRQGYVEGYQDGHDAGINDYFGIDDEQQKFINEIEMDQEMDNYKK